MITPTDLENELNPQGKTTKFQAANYVAAVARAIGNATSMVKANLPERERRMFKTISGYVLTRESDGTTVEFTLPEWMTPASGHVWVDLRGTYRDRKLADAVSITIAGNVVTLDKAPGEGEAVVGDFVMNGSFTPDLLKSMCTRLAANEIRRIVPSLMAETDRAMLDNEMMFLRDDLKSLRRHELRIDEWDELTLVEETETITPSGWGVICADGW